LTVEKRSEGCREEGGNEEKEIGFFTGLRGNGRGVVVAVVFA